MKKFLPFLFVFLALQTAQAGNQKLSQAYEQQLIERVKSVFSSEAKPLEIERPICATPIFLEVKVNWDRLSARTKEILQSEIERPTFNFTEHVYDTPEGHFKIHYVTEGDSAVHQPDVDDDFDTHPDWVNTCGEVLEYVWDTEINVLGYDTLPNDGWYPDTVDNGGDDRYDIYLLDLAAKYLGYTQEERFLPAPSFSATSYIVLDNDYVGYGARHSQIEWLQVTVAHEFFHAIQMGYDGTEYEMEDDNPKFYWMEMTAVWMEDMVYDHINDYLGYLSSFFRHPEWSLKMFRSKPIVDDSVLHCYGSCVWPMYLTERPYPSVPAGFDATIIRDIWEECAKVQGNNAIDYPNGKSATDKALEARGITFEESFREFTVWNYFTADRADTQLFYSEGDLFPMMVRVDSLQYHEVHLDTVSLASPPHLPGNLGSNYVVFVPDPELREGGLKINFDGHSGDDVYNVSAVGYNPSILEPFETTFLLNPYTQIGTAEIYNWNTYTEIIMIPAIIKRSPNISWTYEYHAFYDSALHGESPLPDEDKILQNFPNPFVIETESDRTYFPFVLALPSRVRIDIFTLSGERIKTIIPKHDPKLAIGEYLGPGLAMPWNGRNEAGEYISSGIYLYRFRTDRTTVVKKMAVIR